MSVNTQQAGDRPARFKRESHIAKLPHVLTITPFYPTENDDARGCFVAESLAALNIVGVQNTVIGVQPFHRGKVRPNQMAVPASWKRFFSIPGGVGLPSAGAFLFSALLAEVHDLHRRKPVDLIHAHAALPCGHAAALLSRKLGIPFVVTVHGLDVFFTNQVKGYMGQWCKRVSSWVYKSSARTICISERVCNFVLGEVPANTTVVYNGVDSRLFSPLLNDDISQDTILSVGNLIPIKGQELLLRAFAAVRRQFPKLICEIIGDGPERFHLEALARELGIFGDVYFRGRQSRAEVAAAMARCMLFALPSCYEGLGCVYLEAMAAEKAVIACTGQGIDEIIQHGRNGWLIEPNNLSAMTESLLQIIENYDLRKNMGVQARQTVLAQFTMAHQAEALLQIYKECMA